VPKCSYEQAAATLKHRATKRQVLSHCVSHKALVLKNEPERFERDIGDLFALQSEATSRIAVALNLALIGAEATRTTLKLRLRSRGARPLRGYVLTVCVDPPDLGVCRDTPAVSAH
jgi:hypothetical protein